jgi:hypothetical protein
MDLPGRLLSSPPARPAQDVSLPYFPTTQLHAVPAVDMALTGT